MILQLDVKSNIRLFKINIRYGKNEKPPPKTKTLFRIFIECFTDPILKILVVATFISLIAGLYNENWNIKGAIDGFSILIAVIIIVVITTTNNYAKEK